MTNTDAPQDTDSRPAVGVPVERMVRANPRRPGFMETLERAALLLEGEAAAIKECHTLRGRWTRDQYSDVAKAAFEDMTATATALRAARTGSNEAHRPHAGKSPLDWRLRPQRKGVCMENIKPRDWLEIPRVDRISAVMLGGCEFVIGWDGEEGEPATYCDSYVSVPGSKPTAWVECVKLDGKWWDVRDIFSPTFCDQLDVALCAREDFSACAP